MLTVDRLNVYIEASHILRDVSLAVGERELVCLIGRNGAGKTTTLRAIMGYQPPHTGAIAFGGRSLVGASVFEVARMGLGFSPEDSGVFGELTVAENIAMPTWTRATARPAAERIATAYTVFPGLRRYDARRGAQLSGGERKMLSIARALALDPEMLLLDEPFEGLSPAIIPAISEGIHAITRMGRSILLAESNIHHVPEFADRLYVIERGEIIFAGPPAEVHAQADVLKIIGGAP
ncbi:MAG TPA: ABC transporter ATP-binding protein [Candidatus Sulfotelmatobacter sp.]|nr:ABC transporter ATP-binding protein [Candidatus Sulfotelmatobacter sp.]